ncbi:helix-turn-helix transcriptional regulator [Sphaerotilus mobilis]|uniref:Regulatory LuxR family protein n=1 Tax=Sphaerotilus mobilis TaxID=47994 RepID=A0A4Q7LIC9_9BURK|nr:helix-turn-helix transcriptional regulator [Sphaerotilus mobilis]RZS53139.1 regulatory LuxR family protein [Sphaerotilus mobilis]
MTVLPLDSRTGPAWAAGFSDVVQAIGEPDFAERALGALNTAQLRAASWSVYQVRRQQAPVLHLSASLGVPDTTRHCFAAYRAGLYRADRSFDAVRPGHAAVLRMHADEAPSADHREAIYRRHGMLERLSVVTRPDDAEVFAVNLYHHDHQGRFSPGEIEGFAGLAPLLLACVQRHLRLRPVAPAVDVSAPSAAPAADTTSPRTLLQARCPTLTERELDVCERLLRGWSYDGIAADLGLSLATVKTYRARAFERLGMHFKSELFAALLPRQ